MVETYPFYPQRWVMATNANTNPWQWVGTTATTTANYVVQTGGYQETWHQWNGQWVVTNQTYGPVPVAARPTPERIAQIEADREAQRQAARAQQERRDAWYAEARAREAAAREQAMDLLLGLLDDEQAASYQGEGYFDVIGNQGNRYRISAHGQINNVEMLGEDDAKLATFCTHHREDMPVPDAHVAQLLSIVTDEAGFAERAYVHRYTAPVPREDEQPLMPPQVMGGIILGAIARNGPLRQIAQQQADVFAGIAHDAAQRAFAADRAAIQYRDLGFIQEDRPEPPVRPLGERGHAVLAEGRERRAEPRNALEARRQRDLEQQARRADLAGNRREAGINARNAPPPGEGDGAIRRAG